MLCISKQHCYGGQVEVWQHTSSRLNCNMRFSIFLPPQIDRNKSVPVLYWLSGLTCTETNFMQKSGVQRIAAQLGMAVVTPDTSPRGTDVPDDPDKNYDLGLGAGFYVNATQQPWSQHYHMYDYVQYELPALIQQHFSVSDQRSISGHSMGGHGALVMALRMPEQYCSVSAFSPICHPTDCAWGIKAFSHYLGENKETWCQYDAVELIKKSPSPIPMLVDQGEADEFLKNQLHVSSLQQAAEKHAYPMTLRFHQDYDHSYYFIASFIEEHLKFHASKMQI